MANLVQIAQSGVNPVTGSYLSAENRKKLFRLGRTRVSSSAFGGGGSIVPVRSGINPEALGNIVRQDSVAITNLQAQVASLNQKNVELTKGLASIGLLQNQVNILRVTVTDLTKQLQRIGILIDTDTKLERQEDIQQVEDERRSIQRKLRVGKEGELEKKIQSALVAPVRAIAERVQGTLQSLMGFFGTLFIGWLTNQGIDALRASFNDNKRKLEDIKNSVIRNLAIVGGIFAIFKFGIGAVLSSIYRVSTKVGQFLLSNTIGRLFSGLARIGTAAAGAVGLGGGAKPTPTPSGGGKPTPTPTGGGKPGGKPAGGKPAGGFGTLIGTGIEAFQGNWGEALLGATAFLPGPVGKIGKGAFWLEQGLDIFGKGVIPEAQKEQEIPSVTQNNTVINNDNTRQNIRVTSQPSQSTTPQNTPPASMAQSPMVSTPKVDLKPSGLAPNVSPQEPLAAPPKVELNQTVTSAEVQPQQSLSPQSQELQFGIDTSNQFNLFGDSMEKMLDFNKPPLYGEINIPTGSTKEEPTTSSGESKVPSISPPVQTQRVQTLPFDIGPLPEPKPNIVYRRTGSDAAPTPNMPLKTGEASEVPMIASANNDNMYVLYSQVNYNVVM